MSAWSSMNEITTTIQNKLKGFLQIEDPNIILGYANATKEVNSGRQELLIKCISTLFGLSVSFAITYFGLKYLSNVLDPTRKEKQEAQRRAELLLKRIGVKNAKLDEYELCIAADLVHPLDMEMSWEDIGGLDDVIEELKETVLITFTKREYFSQSKLLQPPKGVLLYGPPGCGKTMIAKAMAKASGARFINLQVSSLFDKWYGESQKRAVAVFSLAKKIQPVIIFIDEIDSFLRSRMSADHESTAMMKTQFMSLWDGLLTDKKCQIMIVGATNRPNDVDAAILRRMPSVFYIGRPDSKQRISILQLILSQEYVSSDVDLNQLSEETRGFSGSDLQELCRNASLYRARELIYSDSTDNVESTSEVRKLRPLEMGDLLIALEKMRHSKKELSSNQHIL